MEVTRPTLIFDGECGFCTTSANWISRHWSGPDAPVAVPWQLFPPEQATALHLTRADFERSAWWITDGRPEGGSTAIARALVAARGPWGVVGRILLVPPLAWVAPLGYRVVARYRHRLPGGTPACRI